MACPGDAWVDIWAGVPLRSPEPSSETTDTGGTSEPSSETIDTSTPEDTSIPEDTSPEEPTSEPSEPATDSSDTSVDRAFVFESAAQKAEEFGGFGCSTIQFGGIALFWFSALLVSFRREG